MDKCVKLINDNVKSNYRAKTDDKDKLIRNLANYGAEIGSQGIVQKKGDYSGFSVEFLSRVKPLFTNYRIIKALELLEKEEYSTIIRVLDIEEDYNEYGLDIIFYIITNWFIINGIQSDILKNIKNFNVDYDKNKIKQNNDSMKRLKTQRHDPINYPIKVTGIGKSKKGNSVVPESWLGREFESAEKLHNEMNNLDWRKNKPAVNFCCIYSMSLMDNNNSWMKKDVIIKTQIDSKKLYILTCFVVNDKIKTHIYYEEDPTIYINNCSNNTLYYYDRKRELLICVSSEIFKDKTTYKKDVPVSVLVSRLQKSFRRGSKSSKILSETVNKLNDAPFYNLPDQHYAKVSGTRQLLWRSYISIVEDVCGYYHNKTYDLLDFFILSLICQINPELQLKDIYIEQIKNTLLNVQNIDYAWPWRKGEEVSDKKFKTYGLNCVNDPLLRMIDSMILALKFMPMMTGDRIMLSKCINYVAEYHYDYRRINYMSDSHYLKMSNPDIEKEVLISSNDMHCYPNVLLSLQGCIPFLPTKDYTTPKLSSFIWENSSKFNFRYSKNNVITDKNLLVYDSLKSIQKNYLTGTEPNNLKAIKLKENAFPNIINKQIITDEISRIGFILIFGQKVRLPSEGKSKPSLEIVLAGDKIRPCKVKKYSSEKYLYLEDKERYDGEKRFVEYIEKGLTVELPHPPKGFTWTVKDKVKIKAKIVKSDPVSNVNEIDFYVNGIKIAAFDSSIFLDSVGQFEEIKLDDSLLSEIIDNALYIKNTIDGLKLNVLMRDIGFTRQSINDCRVFELNDHKFKGLSNVFRHLYTRIQVSDVVEIGPVDRSGKKTHNSINYQYEGVYWRFMNLLYMLFPFAVKIKGDFRYELNPYDPSYYNMIKLLKKVSFSDDANYETKSNITVTTKLWDHQQKSVNKIFDGMIKSQIERGFGDCSFVGAGKTLTALSIMSKLHNYNVENKITNYRGFLIMVPTVQLYKTWKDEIEKHTKGFEVILHNSDGSLTSNKFPTNAIVITTMGRIRDHPISNPWILVVIDECLTVQNKEALQTEEALRQSNSSRYNCILLSATFFRTRFEKLFYMLKMLKTGIPEKIEYLDAILAESLVCNITENDRKWHSNTVKKELTKAERNNYDTIIKTTAGEGYEKIYMLLNKYIYDNINYTKYFEERIKEIENDRPNCKILIYARSKEEADKMTSKNIGRYPDITKKHVVVSYSEGTYGLNDLVIFDTILTRPPNPDALPQMKGRLDRSGQKASILYLEYILIKNTIEEALLIRLDVANNFYNSHIMPLAEFYELAVTSSLKNK
ncbi:DEAD/SNF2-like helicase [Catovirus CTV1]|uniref:DEAD/SNF2-like helicase n=1 Tax=Catovirus CTV1 TaxID=1977631 RepID=A0A1V0SAU6_9VIRU|nr:DEAD/SNF2-like helicase [Catovirus CTV1]